MDIEILLKKFDQLGNKRINKLVDKISTTTNFDRRMNYCDQILDEFRELISEEEYDEYEIQIKELAVDL